MWCTFHRASGIPNEPLIFQYNQRDKLPPTRRPSALPAPGDLSINMKVGQELGFGASARVYDTFIDPSPAIASLIIPPLVVKISRPGRQIKVDHDAYYYEEMECLQGSVIPRCYGLFKGEIPVGYSLHRDLASSQTEKSLSGDSASPDDAVRRRNPDAADPRACSQPDSTVPVSILVMEKLGDRLPVGTELEEYTLYVPCHEHIFTSLMNTFLQSRSFRVVLALCTTRCGSY